MPHHSYPINPPNFNHSKPSSNFTIQSMAPTSVNAHTSALIFSVNRQSSASSSSSSSSDYDIQMNDFYQVTNSYTSLKDLLVESPTYAASPGRDEIPIKEPLVQLAAWAYLRPSAVDVRDKEMMWWRRMVKKLCGVLGCFNGIFAVAFKLWLTEQGVFWL